MTAPLTRFFFHVVGAGQTHSDDSGEFFASVQLAQNHAIRIAYELRHDAYDGYAVCVTDAAGTELARVAIDGAVL